MFAKILRRTCLAFYRGFEIYETKKRKKTEGKTPAKISQEKEKTKSPDHLRLESRCETSGNLTCTCTSHLMIPAHALQLCFRRNESGKFDFSLSALYNIFSSDEEQFLTESSQRLGGQFLRWTAKTAML